MTEKIPSEPSMDEILASIRQLISSESKEEPQPYFPDSEIEDILDLTHTFPEDQENTNASSLPLDMKFQGSNEWTSHTNDQDWSKNEENPPYQAPISQAVDPALSHDSLLSQSTFSETAHAFHLLNKNIQEKQAAPDPDLQEKPGGQALENLLREMLKPLLKEWLDVHLPPIVRSIVTQQVEKIVQQSGNSR